MVDEGGIAQSISPDLLLKLFFHLLAVGATSYVICLKVLPLLLEKKNWLTGFLYLLVSVYLIGLINRIAVIYLLEPILGIDKEKESVVEIAANFPLLIRHYIIGNIAGALPFIIFYLILDRQMVLRKQVESEQQKKEAELIALKSQLNPHFLFNTLNNIYSLSLQQSPLAAVSIEKLSFILDYVLYRCTDNYVSLQKEIELIENYMELGEIRYGNRLTSSFTHSIDNSYKIAPLLLLTIVENMLKHSADGVNGQIHFLVDITAEKNQLKLVAENSFDENSPEGQGIGLTNLQKQLDLLYPDRYTFGMKADNGIFSTHLSIDLT
jgi:sensor histidine kinase YesM